MRALLLVNVLALVGAGRSGADEQRIDRFNDLPADAEVHAVTISEPLHCGVSHDEITDWKGLIKALRAKDGPGAHIRKRLPEDAENDIVNERAESGTLDGVAPNGVPLVARARLSRALKPAMWVTSFYDKGAFAGVELPERTKKLVALGDKRTVYQNELLNRDLLAAAFPTCIAPTPDDFHVTRVIVKAGRPVVLVLSCSPQCRWEVTVEKGATVAGIVLSGSMAQEVVGANAPVVYDAKQLPNGSPVKAFGAHTTKQEGKSYELMHAAIKEATGRDFTKFQGYAKGTKEPFVVQPGAK